MLGRAEVESILAEQGMVGVTCEFCNRRYSFVAADALRAVRRADGDAPPDGAHGEARLAGAPPGSAP